MHALAVVKFGSGLSSVEGGNRMYAFEHVRNNFMRVP